MTDAENLFSETFARWIKASATVSNFRSTFAAVASNAKEHLELSATGLFRKLHEDPQWTGILTNIKTGQPASAKPVSEYEELGRIGAQVIFDSTYASLDAAVLVFYHSLLDATAFDYCRASALHAPEDWEQELKHTKIDLHDIQDKSYEQLLRVKLDERLEKLERESLLSKMDRLFMRCGPPSGWSPMMGYVFNREMIKQFDDQRHEIVHGKALGKPLTHYPVSDDSIAYVDKTGMYLMGLVNFKYGLRVDPQHFSKTT